MSLRKVTVSSCPSRSLCVLGGWLNISTSKMCECGPVGQCVCVEKPDEPKISTKLGKNWNESKPYFSARVGLMPSGMGPRSVRLVHGPAALASITHSIGLEYGVFRDGSPANENIRCGPMS